MTYVTTGFRTRLVEDTGECAEQYPKPVPFHLYCLTYFFSQRSNLSKNDERCKRAIERFLDSSEKRLIKYGRRCETLEDVIMNLQDIEVTENLLWFKV